MRHRPGPGLEGETDMRKAAAARKAGRVASALILSGILAPVVSAHDWPQWRGADMNGISAETHLPTTWSLTESIDWKLPLPSWSASTPIVWGDSVFLHVSEGEETFLWRLDRTTRTVVWKRNVTSLTSDNKFIVPPGVPHQVAFVKQQDNYSSPSPVTDGQAVWVMTGTGILKSFDYAGKELWARDIRKEYGNFGLGYGYHSSPLLHEDSVYVQVIHGQNTNDPANLLRIDKKTGKTVWRVERATDAELESKDSYRTPILARADGHVELIIAGADYVTAHDPATGRELWRGGGFNPKRMKIANTIGTPVVSDGLVYTQSRGRMGPLIAYRAGGTGDITATHRAWTFDNGPHIPSPVTDGRYFYSVTDNGILWCLNAKTGEVVYGPERLAHGTYTSSIVLADGKLYLTNEEAVTTVVAAGPTFERLAQNTLEGYTLSSMAVSDGQLFVRTSDALWVIGKRR